MELEEAVGRFKKDLAEVKADGKTAVEIDNIEKYLEILLKDAVQSDASVHRQHENNLAYYRAKADHSIEHFKSVMSAGKEAINAAIIINGGAAITMMSFMGNAAAKGDVSALVSIASKAMLMFGVGVFLGGLAFGTRYISQFLYTWNQSKRILWTGHVFNGVSWIATASSFLLFASGVSEAYHKLTGT